MWRADGDPLSTNSAVRRRLQLLPVMLLVFVPFVHADSATAGSPQHGMMTCQMAAHRSNRAIFQAAARLSLRDTRQAAQSDGGRTHVS